MDGKGILYSYDLHGNKLWTWDLLKPDDDFSILSLNGLSIGIHSTLYVSFGSVLYAI